MRSIFVNLPVQDLAASRAFFAGLGFGFNDTYSDDSAACLVVADNISVMLVSHPRFTDFITDAIADAHSTTEVLLCLSCDSRAEVDDLTDKAIAAGGKPYRAPEEHGPMYGRSFTDLDGHVWELMSMG